MTAKNREVENLEVEAAGLLFGLQGMHGENLLLFREPEHLALLCEVNAELAGWMRARSEFSVLAEWSWRHTKAHLDSRAASRAFDSVMKRPGARKAQPPGRDGGTSGEVAA